MGQANLVVTAIDTHYLRNLRLSARNSLRHTENSCLELVFADLNRVHDGLTFEQIADIMLSPDLRTWCEPGYYGREVAWTPTTTGYQFGGDPGHPQRALVVHDADAPLLKEHEKTLAYWFEYDGTLTRITPQHIASEINKCDRLHRLMGKCEKCPDYGGTCGERMLTAIAPPVLFERRSETVEQQTLMFESAPRVGDPFLMSRWVERIEPYSLGEQCIDGFVFEDFKKRTKNYQTSIAGHQVIAPVTTHPDGYQPDSSAVRPLSYHDFSQVTELKEHFSERSKSAAKTRNFKRKECKECCFAGADKVLGTCYQWRPADCKHKAWDRESVVAYTLRKFEQALEGSGFTLADMWTVAHWCGIEFKKRHLDDAAPRLLREVIRFFRTNPATKKPAVVVDRASYAARDGDHYRYLNSMSEFLLYLKDSTFDAPFIPRAAPTNTRDRETMACWIHLSIPWHGPPYAVYGGMYGMYEPRIGVVDIGQAYIGFGARVTYWHTKEDRPQTAVSDIVDVFTRYGYLPWFAIRKCETEEPFELSNQAGGYYW